MDFTDLAALVGSCAAGATALAGWQRWRSVDRRKARRDEVKDLEDRLSRCHGEVEGLRDALRDSEEMLEELERRLRGVR